MEGGEDNAGLPSVHLRWGLEQMRSRGWRTDDWGELLDEHGNVGDDPICLLASVSAPMDSPTTVAMETPEQFYLRLAFAALDWDPPLYLSQWNDDQTDFASVETLVCKAIELAEADEHVHVQPYVYLSEADRNTLFGIADKLDTANREFEAAKGAAKG